MRHRAFTRSQVVLEARLGAGSSIWLGALNSPHLHSQLDGFKSRALRAQPPPQRHRDLYEIEWRSLTMARRSDAMTALVIHAEWPCAALCGTSLAASTRTAALVSGGRAVAVAPLHAMRRAVPTLETLLALVQAQACLLVES